MKQLQEQIRALLVEGRTEDALDALLKGVKTQYANLSDQGTLLRARWEKIEQESNLGLISREEAMRQTNQINVAILDLIEALGADQTTPAQHAGGQKRLGWAIMAGLLVLILAVFFWWKNRGGTAADAVEKATSGTAVRFPQGKAVVVAEYGEEVRYEILAATVEKINNEEQRLTIQLLCSPMLSPRRSMNLWSKNFRFIPDGKPAVAPANNLNLIAESHASTEGEVRFLLPAGVRSGQLWLKYVEKEASLEVAW